MKELPHGRMGCGRFLLGGIKKKPGLEARPGFERCRLPKPPAAG